MGNYRRMIGFVRPHITTLSFVFLVMLANSVVSGLPIIGIVIPLVDTIISGKPIIIPHQDYLPGFVLDWVYQVNALPHAKLLNLLILWTIVIAFFRSLYCSQPKKQSLSNTLRCSSAFARLLTIK